MTAQAITILRIGDAVTVITRRDGRPELRLGRAPIPYLHAPGSDRP